MLREEATVRGRRVSIDAPGAIEWVGGRAAVDGVPQSAGQTLIVTWQPSEGHARKFKTSQDLT